MAVPPMQEALWSARRALVRREAGRAPTLYQSPGHAQPPRALRAGLQHISLPAEAWPATPDKLSGISGDERRVLQQICAEPIRRRRASPRLVAERHCSGTAARAARRSAQCLGPSPRRTLEEKLLRRRCAPGRSLRGALVAPIAPGHSSSRRESAGPTRCMSAVYLPARPRAAPARRRRHAQSRGGLAARWLSAAAAPELARRLCAWLDPGRCAPARQFQSRSFCLVSWRRPCSSRSARNASLPGAARAPGGGVLFFDAAATCSTPGWSSCVY
mmetsp:Transcript_13397/g.35619  ORF Transcript_13397/g.35619 Transcript_13397/m.35619 type:complete len:273 (+) Transcript_13397:353-1171(+)